MPETSRTQDAAGRRVLLAGATGLVGQQCLRLLVQDERVSQVLVLLRRPVRTADLLGPGATPQMMDKLELCVTDFDHLADHPDWFAVDWVFCALGTTIRQAGSQAAFRRVDLDYPLQIAQLARAQGATHFLLVSALGADAGSRVFYNRVKGELETAVRALGFESLTLARPSLLMGERAEVRLGEVLAQKLAFLTPAPWKPVHVSQVARGLWTSTQEPPKGVRILNNTALRSHRVGT
jgi:uncharacterized protein YbjT (DUF2867 family)